MKSQWSFRRICLTTSDKLFICVAAGQVVASPQVKPSEAPFGGIRWEIGWDVLKKMIYLFVAVGNGGRKSFSVIYHCCPLKMWTVNKS